MDLQPTVELASLGMADSLILMVMALVVFGPRRLPQIGRQIGKLMYEFRKASNDFKYQMEEELRNAEEADRRKKEEERLKALALAAPAPAAESPMVPAATPDVGTPSAEAAVESPYPVDGQYPYSYLTPLAAQAAETAPTILPPSTGEQVAAARPGSHTVPKEPTSTAETARVPRAEEESETEGGGGFTHRIKPTESTLALATEEPISPGIHSATEVSGAGLSNETDFPPDLATATAEPVPHG